ncbi:putative multidrug resistance protein EmrY [Anatilimnocola aggregata]|uniref:Putative multidrug resistance protein EmrY n=1 Tax=Anatilimnocola aggregata TaxID=2528021 RepID=A0A517Y7K0_9BACT|nr:DHA2 family efflux MFS transporter permease subunit [Anatilimnocola aggregata]QDU26175.1 putative multidrug resistance protein EmrY [Anatilimnocola aggregata]
MNSIKLAPAARPAFNPWLIAFAVVIPTFMEVLDTTIANVALRYIAGGLSVAETDSEWVITSYLAANALVLSISGWLSARLGRRNYFLISIAVFTIASGLCGMATSLGQIIAFRILQGFAGGGLQPSSQAILIDSFPPEKQGTAMSVFGIAALIGPIIGPTLGGWLVVNYDWRWIFYINVPVGIAAFAASHFLVRDPEYLQAERQSLRKKPLNFDLIGLGLLALVVASWEILLSKGQEWNWLEDPFWRIQTLASVLTFGLLLFVLRELRSANPLLDLRVLKERNLAVSGIVLFSAFAVLYAASIALPAMLQTLFGYDALYAGLVLSPGGISSITMLVIVGVLLGRGTDARYLIAAGLVVLAVSNLWMASLNIEISPWQIIGPRMVLTAGLGLIFAPINVAAYLYIPKDKRGSAIALLSLLRNEGGSVGTSMSQTIQQRREQFHLARLNDFLDPTNPHVTSFQERASALFYQTNGDHVASQLMSVNALDDLRQQQALSLAYFDVFFLAGVLAIVLVPLVLLMRRSVAGKGTHIAAD